MFEEIVGSSPALQAALTRIVKVAPTDSTVLITGETGTGKELAARAIHKRSRRSAKAFIPVNCAAIPTSLIASELFGYEKGAFTGALQQRAGRFELAHCGGQTSGITLLHSASAVLGRLPNAPQPRSSRSWASTQPSTSSKRPRMLPSNNRAKSGSNRSPIASVIRLNRQRSTTVDMLSTSGFIHSLKGACLPKSTTAL